MRNEKKCPRCRQIKPLREFVTVYGYRNPKGKYCQNCFDDKQKEHAIELLEGRDFCLYCGKKIHRTYDWTPDGNSARTYLHCDHMDPISLGGPDNSRNTVYCCVECNERKSDKPFIKWLKELTPKQRKIARHIYIKKRGRAPEQFKPKSNRKIVISIDVGDLLRKYS